MRSSHHAIIGNIDTGGSTAGLMRRIWAEFMEMPGLGLTKSQAQRLWSLDERTCGELLDKLVALEFLARGIDGQYRRLSVGGDGRTPSRMAKTNPAAVPESARTLRRQHKKSA